MIRRALFAAAVLLAAISPASGGEKRRAASAVDFLNSIGVCVHVQHGQDASRLAPLLRYAGVRNVRDAADRNYDMSGMILLHREAGVKVVMGSGSGTRDEDLEAVLRMARELHDAGALLAVEGPNEPNNFGGLTYKGVKGGGEFTWMPVAEFQRDLYARVKADPALKNYPVYGVSEVGAQTDDCGLQFLTIPEGAASRMPAGTRYADYANAHNYMYHPSWPDAPHDNQVWNAADPSPECRADGLYGNFGRTWLKKFEGYSQAELDTLPRVTTVAGVRVGDCDGRVTEHVQGCNYLNLFLAQFVRGWDKTFVYEFLDDPDGAFGFYASDYAAKRKAADYLHNMTTILRDEGPARTGALAYTVDPMPATAHDLLLRKSDGGYWLVVWGERVAGADKVTVTLPARHREVRIYDPTVGESPVRVERRTAEIELEVSDRPLILELIK